LDKDENHFIKSMIQTNYCWNTMV